MGNGEKLEIYTMEISEIKSYKFDNWNCLKTHKIVNDFLNVSMIQILEELKRI